MTSVVKKQAEISTADAAQMIGCSRNTVLRLIHRGDLKAYAFSDHGWFHIDALSIDAYLRRIRGARNGHHPTRRKKR